MPISRFLSLLALVLALAAGSVGMALARNHPGAAGTIDLCTTYGTETVLIDAQGNPVAPQHPCPHCTPAMAALTGIAAPLPAAPATLVPLHWAPPAHLAPSTPTRAPFQQRAPPVAV